MSFPARLEHAQKCSHMLQMRECVHRPLKLLADSDYKPWEYLSLVASRSYQELHAM